MGGVFGEPEVRLAAMGLVLPELAGSIADYVPVIQHGDLVWVSGQLPFDGGGRLRIGRLGEGVTLESGCEAASFCALNILSHLSVYLGGLGRIERVIRLGGYVASGVEFTEHSAVIDGASRIMGGVFGECGRHSRVAFGVSSLPRGACVEIEALVAVRGLGGVG